MVNLMIGEKGSGKTQRMIEKANEVIKASKGNVFFLKKTHRDTYSLSFNVRVVCMDDYDAICNPDKYVGFIYGMTSANHDIEAIFIDGICKYAGINMENLPYIVENLNRVSSESNIDFYVSLSAKPEEVAGLENCTVLAQHFLSIKNLAGLL